MLTRDKKRIDHIVHIHVLCFKSVSIYIVITTPVIVKLLTPESCDFILGLTRSISWLDVAKLGQLNRAGRRRPPIVSQGDYLHKDPSEERRSVWSEQLCILMSLHC